MTIQNANLALFHFQVRHKEIVGNPYMVIWGKDNKIMKQIVDLYGMDKAHQLIDAYFYILSTDDFLRKTGASVGIFRTQIPKLLMDMKEKEEDSEIGKWKT